VYATGGSGNATATGSAGVVGIGKTGGSQVTSAISVSAPTGAGTGTTASSTNSGLSSFYSNVAVPQGGAPSISIVLLGLGALFFA